MIQKRVSKFLLLVLCAPLYWLDLFLAKARRAIRRVTIKLYKVHLPVQEVRKTLLGPSVSELVVPILGRYSTSVLDIGARWGAEGVWWRLEPLTRLIGFEPDVDECAQLNLRVKDPSREIFVPRGLGPERKKLEFYVTRQPGCSSIYEPDTELITRYPILKEIEPVRRGEIQVMPLDEWWEEQGKPEVSFLKIDTQGYELEILRGAHHVLKECLGLEVEVEFSGLYRNQPLFHEVDSFLRKNGFVIWSLEGLCRYQEYGGAGDYSKQISSFRLRKPGTDFGGRLFWGNAIYFRDYHGLKICHDNQRSYFLYAAFFEALGDFSASSVCLERGLKCNPSAIAKNIKVQMEWKFKALRGEVRPILSAPLSWYPQLAFRPLS